MARMMLLLFDVFDHRYEPEFKRHDYYCRISFFKIAIVF